MIRILIPENLFAKRRVDLVRRLTPLNSITHDNVKRSYSYLQLDSDKFLEGFLENESKLEHAGNRLSDDAWYIEQLSIPFQDMKTFLIECGSD